MRWYWVLPTAVAAVSIALAGLMPVRFESNEERFEIPKGTWALRRSGSDVEILPSEIRLMVEVRNVLVLRNADDVPQIFGPTLIMPGQSLRLPFEEVSENQFVCTAHASGQLTVLVEAIPTTVWSRIRWRMQVLEGLVASWRWKGLVHD